MKKMNPVEMSYHFNEYLVKETAKYLQPRDICLLSMVSRLYNRHMKKLDYCFKEHSYRQFCSEYESYNIQLFIKQESNLSTSSVVFQNTKRVTNEKDVPYNYTWKSLLTIGLFIKEGWQLNSSHKTLQEDLMNIRNAINSDLKECQTTPSLRRTNSYVENDFNSPLQIFLYDFLYSQQDLYEDYDNKLKNTLDGFNNRNGITCNRPDLPFAFLINDFDIVKTTIKNSNDKKTLQYMRWYYCIDQPNTKDKNKKFLNETIFISQQLSKESTSLSTQDELLRLKTNIKRRDSEDIIEERKSILLTTQFVKTQLGSESNPVFYTLKCLYLTLTFYCQYTMRFLYTTYRHQSKPKQLLDEYRKRYQNYIETAKNLNNKLENLNVCLNYLYEEHFQNWPFFPKFSILRMCMLIWNTELSCYVDQYDTLLSSLKLALTSLYSKQMRKELKALFKTKKTIFTVIEEMQEGWSMISLIKGTTCSTLNSSINKTILNVNKSIRRDVNTHNVIIEQMLSSFSDMFCNEYSVYYMNSLDIITNNIYNEIESNFCDSIEIQIKRIYERKVIKSHLLIHKMVEAIIGYFSSNFYSKSILNKMKIRLYKTVRDVLIGLISNPIIKDFNKYLDVSKFGLMKEFQVINYFSKNDNPYCCTSIYKVLLNRMNDSIIPFKVREYIVINYFKLLSPEYIKDLETLQYIEKWYNDEESTILKAHKQVKKELNRIQLPIEFNKYERLLLSLSIKPTWNTIEEVQKYEQTEQDDNTSSNTLSLKLE